AFGEMQVALLADEPFAEGFSSVKRMVGDQEAEQEQEKCRSPHKSMLFRPGQCWPTGAGAQQLLRPIRCGQRQIRTGLLRAGTAPRAGARTSVRFNVTGAEALGLSAHCDGCTLKRRERRAPDRRRPSPKRRSYLVAQTFQSAGSRNFPVPRGD